MAIEWGCVLKCALRRCERDSGGRGREGQGRGGWGLVPLDATSVVFTHWGVEV